MTDTCPHGWMFAHNCPTQPAPELSDYERATVERIEAAPAAPESFRDQVAIALWRSDTEDMHPGADLERLWPKVVSNFPEDAAAYYRLANAAIAVMRGEL